MCIRDRYQRRVHGDIIQYLIRMLLKLSKALPRVQTQLVSRPQFYFSSGDIEVTLPKFDLHRLDQSLVPKTIKVPREEALRFFREMTTSRRMEIACDALYKTKEIRGFCHLYDGQEAVATGIEAALTFEDPLITAYRDHCQAYLRGKSPYQVIAELLGKATGATQGRGGSMHFYNKVNNFYGGNGIVGAQVPVGTGLAFALKYLKKDNICISMYGDGAANQGQLFEAANMALLWKLPQIFVCENNRYAMGTPTSRHSSNPEFYKRFDVMPGIKVDGNNVFAVKAIFQWSKQWIIQNQTPLCIELDTYRYHGHSMSDPGISYRTREEVSQQRKERDCIETLKRFIIENKIATEEQVKAIDKEVRAEIDAAVEKARADPLPNEASLTKDVYVENPDYYIRNTTYDKSYFPQGSVERR
eukprot:TRINITY_DN6777_c0_g1_i1.p1 TRINITY_DN6777_c0_g1~~TRINITY_DN6777_c0_g1_i1.p1  ORF type:complete len:415 (+),score=119.31 TRINITY_DN6777_c0_g1_i1:66-1310(+)